MPRSPDRRFADKEDLRAFYPKVADDGLILGHDFASSCRPRTRIRRPPGGCSRPSNLVEVETWAGRFRQRVVTVADRTRVVNCV